MIGFWSRRLAATFVLAVWILGAAAPLMAGAHADADIACGEPAWGTSHHQRSQFERVRPPIHDDHCTLCHLQRTLRDAAGETGVLVDDSAVCASALPCAAPAARHAAPRDVASRAPPSGRA